MTRGRDWYGITSRKVILTHIFIIIISRYHIYYSQL